MSDSEQNPAEGQDLPPREPHEGRAPFPIVGLGASAGGLDALERFFSHMPAEPGLALVVVQHLDPNRRSIMPELLSKVTRMPVQQVRDRTPIERDHVYLITPNTTLTLEGTVLRAAITIEPRHNPIDTFFCSLAESQGDQAVGIIFSGGGSDGAQGIKAIHEQGGMSMAQKPALHDSMPRSAIALGVIDYVLPAEEMPARLLAYVRRGDPAAEGEDSALPESESEIEVYDYLRRICAVIQRRTEHDFSRYKQATILRRVQRRMQVRQVTSIRAYLEMLHDPVEADHLFQSLLIGVTRFFRDPEAFDELAREVIPDLLERKRPDQEIRVWVAGCSSGEEAYSIAMVVREVAARLDLRTTVKVFASDIDEGALEKARSGRYPEAISEQISEERLARFFIKQPSGYQVCKDLREMCIFSNHNIITDPPFSHLDLVCCRNVLIYFESDIQKKLVPLFHFALDRGGYVFLGPSETIDGYSRLFRAKDKRNRIYQRKDTLAPQASVFPLLQPLRLPRYSPLVPPLPQITAEQSLVKNIERRLLDEHGPATVVVNEAGDIVYIYGRTRKYLELSVGAPHVNVIDMVRGALRVDLLTALREAVRTQATAVRPDLSIEIEGNIQRLNMIVQPLTERHAESALLMVVFQELGPLLSRKQADLEGAMPTHREAVVQELEAELRGTKESLRTAVEEFKISTEELKSTNEELLSANEELQSANEEMQTSKEELQSINEELQTVNVELQRKVDEVDRANGDLQNLFSSTQIAILFLDNSLHIQKFSPAAKLLFRVIESDVGRPITDIVATVADESLVADALDVVRTLELSEREVRRADGDYWYIRRIRPYRSLENTIDGVVITFVDITELKRALARITHLAAIVDSSQEAIVGQSFDGILTSWNRGAERIYGYTAAEVLGRSYEMLLPRESTGEVALLQERLKRGEDVEPFETMRRCKSGADVIVSLTLSPVFDENGVVSGISVIGHDITARRRAEEALRKAHQHKDDFLAMLGHELRNPLAPILNAAQILRHRGHGDPAVTRAQEIIERQGRHMTRLIDDLLDMSRISRGKVHLRQELVDFVELTRTVIEDHRSDIESASLTIDVYLPGRPLQVLGDRARLAQIVDNLLHNAAKFTEPGGRIFVTMETDPDGAAVSVRVRDTGIGMDAATLSRLFEPFIQADGSLERSRGGLGLGLSVVKSMVDLHEGAVTAESKGPGRGSQFTVRLPLARMPVQASPRGAPREAVPRPTRGAGPQRVLVIEDNVDAAETLTTLLELWGHEVRVAYAGGDGLALAKDFRPQVVLCDIGLPGGLDGYAVARSLRREQDGAAPYLVALTGYGQDEDQRLAAAAGFDRHIVKPVDHDVLEKVLGSRG